MSPLEAAAAALGVINILLLVRRSIWNYAFGMAMVAMYAPVFFFHRLYSDALLQIFFFVVQLYGWWEWRRSAGQAGGEIVVERLSWRGRLLWAIVAGLAWWLWSSAMHRWTDAVSPFWDGAVAAMSVTAQIMLARRLIENWALWVAVDLVAIALYWSRGLYLTAALYVLFLLISAWGWREWSRGSRFAKALPR